MKASNQVNAKRERFNSNAQSIVKVIGVVVKNITLFPLRALLFFVEKIGNLFRFSLSYKIGFTYILIATIAFSIFVVGVSYNYYQTWLNSEKQDLLTIAEKTADEYRREGLPTGLKSYPKDNNIVIYQQLKYGILTDKEQMDIDGQYSVESGQSIYIKYNNQFYVIAAASFKHDNVVCKLEIIQNISYKVSRLRKQFIIILAFFLLSLLVITYLSHKINKRLLSPIAKMTVEINSIDFSDPNSRLNVQIAQDELKDLTIQFNRLLDRIEDSYQRNKQFVSDASHELRTPISVIDGYVNMLARWGKKDEAILDEAITEIKSETAHMQNLIEKLLFLARSEKGQVNLNMEACSLTELVNEVCRETAMIDTTHQIMCSSKIDVKAKVDKEFIKQMLRIFIENSRKFTSEGGKIELSTDLIRERAAIIVSDTGCGIDEEDLPHIFDRFYKGDKARTQRKDGNGLGLSIAKWIIDQHGATAEISSEIGKGTKIFVIFNASEK